MLAIFSRTDGDDALYGLIYDDGSFDLYEPLPPRVGDPLPLVDTLGLRDSPSTASKPVPMPLITPDDVRYRVALSQYLDEHGFMLVTLSDEEAENGAASGSDDEPETIDLDEEDEDADWLRMRYWALAAYKSDDFYDEIAGMSFRDPDDRAADQARADNLAVFKDTALYRAAVDAGLIVDGEWTGPPDGHAPIIQPDTQRVYHPALASLRLVERSVEVLPDNVRHLGNAHNQKDHAGKRGSSDGNAGVAAARAKEDEIRNITTHEELYAFDAQTGDLVFSKLGSTEDKAHIEITAFERSLLKDTIATHNHPLGWESSSVTIGRNGYSFSKDDVVFAVNADLAEIRAVSPGYRYSLKRPEGGWPVSPAYIARKHVQYSEEQKAEWWPRISNKSLSIETANAEQAHDVMLRLSRLEALPYTREPYVPVARTLRSAPFAPVVVRHPGHGS